MSTYPNGRSPLQGRTISRESHAVGEIGLLLQHHHDTAIIECLEYQLSRRWRLRVIYVLLGLLWAVTWPLLGWWLA